MHEPPLPADESSRLAALPALAILDTPPEQEFDDLTALAAHVCGMAGVRQPCLAAGRVGVEALARRARGIELACRAPDAGIPDLGWVQAAVATLVSSSVRWRQSLQLPITPSEPR